jgi:hypothetical protein
VSSDLVADAGERPTTALARPPIRPAQDDAAPSGGVDAVERRRLEAQHQPDAPPVPLEQALATFRRWLHLPDVDPLLAIAATAVANRSADASPVWLLVIGPPSAGKTEQIGGLVNLPEAVLAATVTESALLSGTSLKERAANATGGLLRQIGDRGLIVMKDFTSVLAQNRDARAAALGALREVYDGSWSRPVGSDGGRLLTWRGKVGVVAGCTNAYDRHHAVISQLGDRFLIVRLAVDEDPDAAALSIGLAALAHSDDEHRERAMRAELAAAICGLVAGADRSRAHRILDGPERRELVRLARYAGISRTPVDRDPYTGDLRAMPAPEGPGRLTIALKQVLGGLEALGADSTTCWRVVRRLAVDTPPALRSRVLRVMATAREPLRTAVVAERAGLVAKTTARELDELALIDLVSRSKAGTANNSPDLWAPTNQLKTLWPENGAIASASRWEPPPRNGRPVAVPIGGRGGRDTSSSLDRHDGAGVRPALPLCGKHGEFLDPHAGCAACAVAADAS